MPAALLLHGLSSSPAGWWRVRGWLDGLGWSVEAPALLGHGGREPATSYRLDDYATDALRHRPADGPWDLVLGHSLGGATATVAASREPAWTRRLALLDPVWRIPADRAAEIRAGQLSELELTRESYLAASPLADPRDVEAKLAAIAQVDPTAVARSFDDNPAWDVLAVAAALAVPTLVLAGDPAVFTLLDPADSDRVAAANRLVELHRVAGAGHGVHRDRPAEVRTLLEPWLGLTSGDSAV